MEFHWRESVCLQVCVHVEVIARQCLCVVLLGMCVSTGNVVALVWSPPGKGELISQCVGFSSHSELDTCYSSLSCCHRLHTAGPCPLRSPSRVPTSLKPGERSDPVAVSELSVITNTCTRHAFQRRNKLKYVSKRIGRYLCS